MMNIIERVKELAAQNGWEVKPVEGEEDSIILLIPDKGEAMVVKHEDGAAIVGADEVTAKTIMACFDRIAYDPRKELKRLAASLKLPKQMPGPPPLTSKQNRNRKFNPDRKKHW